MTMLAKSTAPNQRVDMLGKEPQRRNRRTAQIRLQEGRHHSGIPQPDTHIDSPMLRQAGELSPLMPKVKGMLRFWVGGEKGARKLCTKVTGGPDAKDLSACRPRHIPISSS